MQVGKPLGLPKLEKPSDEDVAKWHATYVSEVHNPNPYTFSENSCGSLSTEATPSGQVVRLCVVVVRIWVSLRDLSLAGL